MESLNRHPYFSKIKKSVGENQKKTEVAVIELKKFVKKTLNLPYDSVVDDVFVRGNIFYIKTKRKIFAQEISAGRAILTKKMPLFIKDVKVR